jgi:hypothetical protein
MKDRARTLFYSYMGVLLFLFVLKLLGYPGLALACENETVIAICNYVDNTFIKYICEFIMYMITNVLVLHSIFATKKFVNKQKLIYIFIAIGEIIRLIFVDKMYITLSVDIILLVIVPTIYDKKLFFKSLLVDSLVVLFQLISFFVKEISKTRITKLRINVIPPAAQEEDSTED